MSDKETRTVSLSPDNNDYLKNKDNASAVVDDLITQLREGGDRQTAVVDMQIEQQRREITEAKNRVERLEQGLDELLSLRQELQNEESAELQEARQALENTPKEPDNPAIQEWAKRLGMAPEELLQQLR